MAFKRRQRYHGKPCPYCAEPMLIDQPRRFPTREHVLPRKLGGTNLQGNRLIVCATCNVQKGHKTLTEFLGWLLRRNDRRAIFIQAVIQARGLAGHATDPPTPRRIASPKPQAVA